MTSNEKRWLEKFESYFWYGDYMRLIREYKDSDLDLDHDFVYHHILPLCMGGKDLPINTIKVSNEHHRILHRELLACYRPEDLLNIWSPKDFHNMKKYLEDLENF